MQLSQEFIADILSRAYRVGVVWSGNPAKAERAAALTVGKAADFLTRARKSEHFERTIFSEVRKTKSRRPERTVELPAAIEELQKLPEPRRSFLMLRHGARLERDDAAAVLDVSSRSVSRLERDSKADATAALGIASIEQLAASISQAFGEIEVPRGLLESATDIANRAAAPSHTRVSRPAILATSLSLVVVLFLVGSTLSERMKRFPGYDKVAALVETPDRPESKRETHRVSGTLASLDDWLMANHGIDQFYPPVHLAPLPVKSCRVFDAGGAQVVAVGLAEPADAYVYFFRGADLGIVAPTDGKRAPISSDAWSGWLESDGQGACAVIASRDSLDALKKAVPSATPSP